MWNYPLPVPTGGKRFYMAEISYVTILARQLEMVRPQAYGKTPGSLLTRT